MLCRGCFEVLPRVGSPTCGRCGLPTAFATFVCEACKNEDFGFESARTPLRYEGEYYDRATDETVWLPEGHPSF